MRRAVVFSVAVLAAAACSDMPTSPADPADPLFHHSPPPSDFALDVDGTTLRTSWTPAGLGGDAQHYVVQFQACEDGAGGCAGVLHESAQLDKTVGTYDLEDVEPGFYRARINAHNGGSGGADWSDWSDIVRVGDDALTWYFAGFHRPVNPDPDVLTRVRRGSALPLKFNVYEDEDLTEEITDVDALEASFEVSLIVCDGEVIDGEDFGTTGGTTLRYDEESGQFVQNWQAPRTPGCYRVTLLTAGGSLSARFNVF